MTDFLKRTGLHHGIIVVLVFIVTDWVGINSLFGWLIITGLIGKEFGEAVIRAGGTIQSLTTWSRKTVGNPEGVWEPFDFGTPIGIGIVWELGKLIF